MDATLKKTIANLVSGFHLITPERRAILAELTSFIAKQKSTGQPVMLNFICTHNSRRSHMAQLWAQAAAHFYLMPEVACFSGGTEATAFNPRAVKAMRELGFLINEIKSGDNPVYEVSFGDHLQTVRVFSKRYDDVFNPKKDFAAVMTCSHADENCPVVLGASARIALTYNDPKDFDGTEHEAAKYAERALEIGREVLFAFSEVR